MLARLQWIGVMLAVLVVTHGAVWVAGWHGGHRDAEKAFAAERLKLERAAEARAAQLRAEGDRLAAELDRARTAVRVRYVERVRTVYQVASPTRECLSPSVTAALNTPAQPPDGLLQAPQDAPGGTSEAAAAQWIAGAQAAHEECRAQVARLADWARSVTKED